MADETTKTNFPERITFKSVFAALLKLFNLEKGLFYTLWSLTIRPGEAIRTYLFEDRTKLSKPFGFLFLAIAISTYLSLKFVFVEEVMEDSFSGGMAKSVDPEAAKWSASLMKYYMDYFNIWMLITVPFFSFFSFLFFKKPKLFLAEHFVVNSYIFAYQTFFYILMVPLFIVNIDRYNVIYFFLSVFYAMYAYVKIFNYDAFEGGARGLLTTLAAYITYVVFLVIFILILVVVLIKTGVIEPPAPKN